MKSESNTLMTVPTLSNKLHANNIDDRHSNQVKQDTQNLSVQNVVAIR